ncbi:MAG: hypothetical protein WC701_06250 [Kiritimatiellales bacterium]|jgi:hypothetical protein
MKIISLAAVFVFCSSAVFAETTVELIKERAENGDATAQTLLGLITYYGYQVPRDTAKAEVWFQRAADQGDTYAGSRITKNVRTILSVSSGLRAMSPTEFETKVAQASSVPYEGEVTFDELVVNRDKYIGKVIELSFMMIPVVGTPVDGVQYIYIRDPKVYGSQGGSSDKLYLCGERSLKWRQEIGRNAYGTASTVFALVEKDGLIALGVRQRETDAGREYKW